MSRWKFLKLSYVCIGLFLLFYVLYIKRPDYREDADERSKYFLLKINNFIKPYSVININDNTRSEVRAYSVYFDTKGQVFEQIYNTINGNARSEGFLLVKKLCRNEESLELRFNDENDYYLIWRYPDRDYCKQ